MIPLTLLDTLHKRYSLGVIERVQQLAGGEWKTLFRLDGSQPSVVVSICHRSATTESVQYEHRFVEYLSASLPQVPVPLRSNDGRSFFVHDGRIVVLYPLMPGTMSDRTLARIPAAQLLAHYHQLALAYPDQAPRPGQTAWWAMDWHSNTAWDWPALNELLKSTPATHSGPAQRFWDGGGHWAAEIAARSTQIAEERSAFQNWLAQLAASERKLLSAPIHDDYHDNNLLAEGERITALLDWDGCHPDWLILDLSVATWEFCKEKQHNTINIQHAQAFLQAYAAAGGPIATELFDLVVPFIRCRRMIEILSTLHGISTGEAWNEDHAEYMLHNLLALEELKNRYL